MNQAFSLQENTNWASDPGLRFAAPWAGINQAFGLSRQPPEMK